MMIPLTPMKACFVSPMRNLRWLDALCFQTIAYSAISSRVRRCPCVLSVCKDHDRSWSPGDRVRVNSQHWHHLEGLPGVNITDCEQWGEACDIRSDHQPLQKYRDREQRTVRGRNNTWCSHYCDCRGVKFMMIKPSFCHLSNLRVKWMWQGGGRQGLLVFPCHFSVSLM